MILLFYLLFIPSAASMRYSPAGAHIKDLSGDATPEKRPKTHEQGELTDPNSASPPTSESQPISPARFGVLGIGTGKMWKSQQEDLPRWRMNVLVEAETQHPSSSSSSHASAAEVSQPLSISPESATAQPQTLNCNPELPHDVPVNSEVFRTLATDRTLTDRERLAAEIAAECGQELPNKQEWTRFC